MTAIAGARKFNFKADACLCQENPQNAGHHATPQSGTWQRANPTMR
ncbi:hypothetical protein [Candidatus Nitrotoga sp. BS]|nr:hypothetical protein [Candidatus Nitrotoga sp. BS]